MTISLALAIILLLFNVDFTSLALAISLLLFNLDFTTSLTRLLRRETTIALLLFGVVGPFLSSMY